MSLRSRIVLLFILAGVAFQASSFVRTRSRGGVELRWSSSNINMYHDDVVFFFFALKHLASQDEHERL